MLELLQRSDPLWMGGAVGLALAATAAGAWRFKCLLDPVVRLPYALHLKQYLQAGVFNVLLPSSIGGDAARVWMLGVQGPGHAAALALVLLERLIGVACLLVVALLAWPAAGLPPIGAAGLAGALAALCGVLAVTGLSGPALVARWPAPRRGAAALRSMLGALQALQRQPRAVAAAVAVSLLHQGLTVAVTGAVARACGLEVPAALLLALVPLVWLATFVPLTVGGVGVRELAFLQLFGPAGVGEEGALSMSLGTYAVMAVVALPGAWLLWRQRGRDVAARAR